MCRSLHSPPSKSPRPERSRNTALGVWRLPEKSRNTAVRKCPELSAPGEICASGFPVAVRKCPELSAPGEISDFADSTCRRLSASRKTSRTVSPRVRKCPELSAPGEISGFADSTCRGLSAFVGFPKNFAARFASCPEMSGIVRARKNLASCLSPRGRNWPDSTKGALEFFFDPNHLPPFDRPPRPNRGTNRGPFDDTGRVSARARWSRQTTWARFEAF